jgi:transposase
LAGRRYDSDRFRAALDAKGIMPAYRPANRKQVPDPLDKTLYKQRHKIEIMFGRLKDSRIAMRYELCADTFFSATCIAAARRLVSRGSELGRQ